VINSRLQYKTVRADRGRRLRGHSRMNFVGLIIHGLSALFAYHEVVSTRLLIASGSLACVFCMLLSVVIAIKHAVGLAIPGWTMMVSGLLFLLIVQLLATSLTIVFSVITSRNALGFLPIRDYSYFVLSYTRFQSRWILCTTSGKNSSYSHARETGNGTGHRGFSPSYRGKFSRSAPGWE
jgi:polyisoprenyl-phosphate glycosyltransferase